jgi:hypothetical protein
MLVNGKLITIRNARMTPATLARRVIQNPAVPNRVIPVTPAVILIPAKLN